MRSSKHEELSAERKSLIEQGLVPEWMTTPGYAMFKKKYASGDQSVKDRYREIASYAGKIATELYEDQNWEERFFKVIWNGWLSPSTPILSNLGTERGSPVACHGASVEDSVFGFYDALKEGALLTKEGFGTSAYLGDIRSRGTAFGTDGKANGVVPIFNNFVEMTNQISQGSVRRGSWAGYLEVDHGDFWELAEELESKPSNRNVGWIFTDAFIKRLFDGDKDALDRYKKILRIRSLTGKGYFWKVDAVNRQQTEPYKIHGLKNKAAQLCNEITLHSDSEHSYSCILSSLNLSKYDEWRDTDVIEVATVFLDVVAESFVRRAEHIPGLEKVVRYTKKARSLGLGVMGWHDLLQQKRLAFDSAEAFDLNNEIFSTIHMSSYDASRMMANLAGEPEWCKGTGMRNTHTMAVAPTMSTALIVGSTSQGIEPFVANAWNQTTAAGEMTRINPNLIDIMRSKGIYDQEHINQIIDNFGSVQDVDWLDDQEKLVFRTAYEIPQESIIKQASDRQRFIDQGQSLNLFFDHNATPQYIHKIHKMALQDNYIKGLYYMRSLSGAKASRR